MKSAKPVIILASSSARRVSLLSMLGLPFRVLRVNFREQVPSMPPEESARLVAWRKAEIVRRQITGGILLTADTLVAIDGTIFGKPHSEQEARHMLAQLSGRTHEVYTALVLMDARTRCAILGSEVSHVTMRRLSSAEIRSYVRTGEPMDKAGAYGIQEAGRRLIAQLSGDYYNVVGFPLKLFASLAARFGIHVPPARLRSLISSRPRF